MLRIPRDHAGRRAFLLALLPYMADADKDAFLRLPHGSVGGALDLVSGKNVGELRAVHDAIAACGGCDAPLCLLNAESHPERFDALRTVLKALFRGAVDEPVLTPFLDASMRGADSVRFRIVKPFGRNTSMACMALEHDGRLYTFRDFKRIWPNSNLFCMLDPDIPSSSIVLDHSDRPYAMVSLLEFAQQVVSLVCMPHPSPVLKRLLHAIDRALSHARSRSVHSIQDRLQELRMLMIAPPQQPGHEHEHQSIALKIDSSGKVCVEVDGDRMLRYPDGTTRPNTREDSDITEILHIPSASGPVDSITPSTRLALMEFLTAAMADGHHPPDQPSLKSVCAHILHVLEHRNTDLSLDPPKPHYYENPSRGTSGSPTQLFHNMDTYLKDKRVRLDDFVQHCRLGKHDPFNNKTVGEFRLAQSCAMDRRSPRSRSILVALGFDPDDEAKMQALLDVGEISLNDHLDPSMCRVLSPGQNWSGMPLSELLSVLNQMQKPQQPDNSNSNSNSNSSRGCSPRACPAR